MYYINNLSQEQILNIIRLYELPEQFPEERNLAEYVFDECHKLIPEVLNRYFYIGTFSESYYKSDFRSELVNHLITNYEMVHLIESNQHIQNTGALFEKVDNFFLNQASDNEYPLSDLSNNEERARNAKRNFHEIGSYLELSRTDEKKYTIPKLAAPFISNLAVNYSTHKVLKRTEETQQSDTYLKKNTAVSEKLHLNFYENFNFLLNNFSKLPDIEKVYGIKKIKGKYQEKIDVQATINRVLFEREYNLALANRITLLLTNKKLVAKENLEWLLSLFSLLPNINGRLEYVTSLFSDECSEFEFSRNIEEVSLALIGLATIVIPVMELYYLYMQRVGRIDFDEGGYNKRMVILSKDFFDKRIEKPAEDWLCRIQKNPTVIELNDLKYNDIKGIIRKINVVSEIKHTELRSIFFNPASYVAKRQKSSVVEEMSKQMSDIIHTVSILAKEQVFRR